MDTRNITPEMARAELQRRADARAEIQRRALDNTFMGQAAKVPGYAAGAALSLPGQIVDLAKQVPGAVGKTIANPIDAARDLAGGVARGSQNLASALGEAGQYIGNNPITRYLNQKVVPDWMKVVPNVNIREEMGLGKNNPVDLGGMIQSKDPNQLLSGIGQYGMGAAAGGARILPMMAANAINAATQAQPGQRVQAGVQGAVSAGLPVAALKGANAIRPSRMLAGNLTPEQLQANLEAAQGTTTGLGDVIGSPNLKRLYENVLPRVPFSRADQAMQETGSQLINQGEQHLANLGEGLPKADMGQYLQDALKKASKEATQEKVQNFNRVNDIADEAGVVVPRNNFQSKAQDILDEIHQSPELMREFDPKLREDIESYAQNPQGNSLRLSNIFKGKLNDRANDFYINGKKYEYGLMRDLRDALSDDIEGSITSSRNPDLKYAYEKAMKEYGSKYKPFDDPDITKFTREGGDPDLILSHFLRTGANDRSVLLSKVQNKLPTEVQNLPAYMYLSRAIEDGQLNPLKMRTLYKNLGENQLKTLIPDSNLRKSLGKYTKAVGMNTEAFQTMFNPKTGQRLGDVIPTMGALAGYSMAGGGLPGLAGGAAGVGLAGLAGRATTNLLTSPKVRESLVKAIIKAKQQK